MSPPPLEIRLLGPVEVRVGGSPRELPPSRKARALLAYLVATGRPHGRSALCDLFWQDVDDPRAGLRWALSKLRAVVEHDGPRRPIVSSRDHIAFEVVEDDGVEVDLLRVRAALPSGDPADAPIEALQEAARAFRGAFVEGLELPGHHQFEAWCMGMRERLRSLHVSVHATLAERLRPAPEAALPHALTRISLDPWSEEAHVVAMDLLGEAGRAGQGLELYERCRRMLSKELGIEPSEELAAARHRLQAPPPPRPATRARTEEGEDAPAPGEASPAKPPHTRSGEARDARPGASPDSRSGEAPDTLPTEARDARHADPPDTHSPTPLPDALAQLPAPDHLPEPRPDEPPLVGRTRELETLGGIVEQAAEDGGAATVLVTGEPGIGKTRLLRELVRSVRAGGGCVLSGPVFETEEDRPYGPWADLLRRLPPAALDPEAARGLSGLLRRPPGGPPSDGPAERTQLFDAAAHLLGRLVDARPPALVVLDDVQWLDASSAALLHYLARTLASTPLVLALAARGEEIAPASPVARTLRSLDEAGRLRRIPLGRLDAADTGVLLHAVDAKLDPAPIFRASEGNPLFALAVAASLREGEAEGDPEEGTHRAPADIRAQLRDRLERLGPEARTLLPWAAALGRAFDVRTLVQAAGRPPSEILGGIEELERRGIVRATGSDRFDFTHALLRDAAYERSSEPVRREIHRSIATAVGALEQEGDGPAVASAVARHAELGGLSALAAEACAEAAEECLWVFALDEAAGMVERGLRQAEALSDAVRIPLTMRLLRVYSFRSMRERRPADIEARIEGLIREAREGGLRQVVGRGHAALMEVHYQRGAYGDAERSSLLLSDQGREGEPAQAARSLAETAACLFLLDQAPDDAHRLASEAFELAEAHRLEADVVALARALLAHREGDLPSAVNAFQEVIRLGRRARDRWWELPARTRMVMLELDGGDARRACERARETEELATRLDDPVEAAFARALGAVAAARVRATEAGRALDDAPARDAPVPDPAGHAPNGDAPERNASDAAPRVAQDDALDHALAELRQLDSLWMIAHVQAYAAELELERGRVAEARRRALEALEAGRTLDRPSLLALAQALLARCAALGGDRDGALDHLSSPEIALRDHRLSHRARKAIARARREAARPGDRAWLT